VARSSKTGRDAPVGARACGKFLARDGVVVLSGRRDKVGERGRGDGAETRSANSRPDRNEVRAARSRLGRQTVSASSITEDGPAAGPSSNLFDRHQYVLPSAVEEATGPTCTSPDLRRPRAAKGFGQARGLLPMGRGHSDDRFPDCAGERPSCRRRAVTEVEQADRARPSVGTSGGGRRTWRRTGVFLHTESLPTPEPASFPSGSIGLFCASRWRCGGP